MSRGLPQTLRLDSVIYRSYIKQIGCYGTDKSHLMPISAHHPRTVAEILERVKLLDCVWALVANGYNIDQWLRAVVYSESEYMQWLPTRRHAGPINITANVIHDRVLRGTSGNFCCRRRLRKSLLNYIEQGKITREGR